ncbi:MAG TPA: tetratricopeptide repeat protein, partial [Polyangiales bacterium]|nr:tetratricopeptide repeat protein [Polyangiales bacterium]
MPEPIDTRLSRLRQRAERALASGRRGGEVLGVLETMTREAPDGSQYALFAHRHLAEIQLEGSPWRAALHLRRVIDAGAGDDSVHALMGLCQALLGNYRVAVAEYRKAVRLSPRNPWYHHNLGHLLDVGLGEATTALDHLRVAHRLQSGEDEITASLAHCLARLGQLDEALTMAELAASSAPRNKEHRTLLDWIKQGAPSDEAPPQRSGGKRTRISVEADGMHASGSEAPTSGPTRVDEAEAEAEVVDEPPPVSMTVSPRARRGETSEAHALVAERVPRLLEVRMPEGGFSAARVECARTLWSDFIAHNEIRTSKPAVYAAAIEYAIAKLDGSAHVTQAELARRYGVAPRSISNRYDEIRAALELVP